MAAVNQYFDSTGALGAINQVRMLHAVVNVSDIVAADGRALDQFFWWAVPSQARGMTMHGPENTMLFLLITPFGGKQWNLFF